MTLSIFAILAILQVFIINSMYLLEGSVGLLVVALIMFRSMPFIQAFAAASLNLFVVSIFVSNDLLLEFFMVNLLAIGAAWLMINRLTFSDRYTNYHIQVLVVISIYFGALTLGRWAMHVQEVDPKGVLWSFAISTLLTFGVALLTFSRNLTHQTKAVQN